MGRKWNVWGDLQAENSRCLPTCPEEALIKVFINSFHLFPVVFTTSTTEMALQVVDLLRLNCKLVENEARHRGCLPNAIYDILFNVFRGHWQWQVIHYRGVMLTIAAFQGKFYSCESITYGFP
jgi:hypothetical protein